MEVVLKIIIVLGFIAILGLVFALPVMWLWNATMPDIFGLTRIDFLQALFINWLCGFLFKSKYSSDKK